ncbi:hypothetical protein BH23PLA1_BH23PLA1_13100 [soil metagenome]
MSRWILAAVVPLTALVLLPMSRADEAAGFDFFEAKIRPLLVEHCYQCHSGESKSLKAGLLVDTREGLLEGGDGGPSIEPGDPDASLLIEALRYEGLQMPPAGKLPAHVVADFETWISMGAPDPREGNGSETSTKAEAIDYATARQSWAFQTPTRHDPPSVEHADRLRSPIDAFLINKLEAEGLGPNPEADRQTLIRRLTFDLIGLPPTPEEVEAFLSDETQEAFENLVDRLLDSPRYGERWARMWLDVARYGEDQAHIVGNNKSLFYPNAFIYRDWVINVLNDDLPYDEFVRLQLAADLIAPEDESNRAALGFIGLGPKYYRRNTAEVMADEWEDRVDVLTRGLLALTVACARCHDHKFDPIPTDDYYALAGVFASTEMFNQPLDDSKETEKNGQAKDPAEAIHVIRESKPTDLNVFIRGNVEQKGEIVPRRFLTILSPGAPEPFASSESGRRELAEAIASADNPLTARVIVNRVWGQIFGRPIVGTPSNFGALGEAPTHPELLDDLAARFMEEGWSLKWLLRELVLSTTYRQDSRVDSAKLAADPENRLLGRMPRRRLNVEAWRDAVLLAAGRLDDEIGGPSIDPKDPDQTRRTVYSQVSRLELDRMLALFDFPDPNVHSEGRSNTTTPLQKLFLLNSPFLIEQAEALADRLNSEAEDDEARIELAYLVLYGRDASNEEIALGIGYLGDCQEARSENWPSYTQALLASNEMLFLD